MDKHFEQMKNSVRTRNQEGRTRSKSVMYQEQESVVSLLQSLLS